MKIVLANEEGLIATRDVLMNGGVAVIPTDTVYGLAAHPNFPCAVDRLYTIKGREEKKPIALLASDVESIASFGATISSRARELAMNWPGALTMILPVSRFARDEGFRVPDHDWTRKLLAMCGGVLRVTSANLSGSRPATDAPEALASVGLNADIVVDDGLSRGGTASTVIRVASNDKIEVLREGPIKV